MAQRRLVALLMTLAVCAAAFGAEHDSSQRISRIQTQLTFLGYDAGAPDGILGQRTEVAMLAFQEATGLEQRKVLHDQWVNRLENETVRRVQERLSALGFDPGPADGLTGSRTTAAMRAFREARGLGASGGIDRTLLDALTVAIATPTAPSAVGVAVLATDDFAGIQRRLTELGYDPGPVDGAMGSRTRNAIRAFQKNNGITETGRTDQSLVQALAQARMRPIAASPTFTVDPVEARIRRVQTQLTLLGHAVGEIDGRMGSQTRNAIRAFQRTQGMSANGELSQPLFERLNRVSVRAVQQRLADAGFKPGRADGNLGPRTRSAIREYEQARGLPSGGELSDALLQALAVDPGRATAQTPPGAPSAPRTNIVVRTEPSTLSAAVPGTSDTIEGTLTFHDGTADSPPWCTIGNIMLGNEWCETFSSGSAGRECSVTLRDGRVVAVRCG